MSRKESYLILMADGNINDHNLVKKASRECGINHVFNSVYNGRQLLDHFLLKGAYSRQDDVQPDLVIMDIHLDLVNGFDVLQFLHDNREKYPMPVYVISDSGTEQEVSKATQLGIAGYFRKPSDNGEYAAIIKDICSKHFRQEEGLRQ